VRKVIIQTLNLEKPVFRSARSDCVTITSDRHGLVLLLGTLT
jgi:hypothetical protein